MKRCIGKRSGSDPCGLVGGKCNFLKRIKSSCCVSRSAVVRYVLHRYKNLDSVGATLSRVKVSYQISTRS